MPAHQAPALDQLVRHQEDVRRLVASLLRDDHAAEDVVQETWLRALEKGPRDPDLLGGWLRAVGKRVALNRLRGNRRRAHREEDAARFNQLPSSEEIADRLEVQGRMMKVLDGLPEVPRQILRDRYLGALTPTQLAARDGISVDTIKSRLARARAILREQLERDGLGSDQHWSVAVLPLLAARPVSSLALGASAGAGASLSLFSWLFLMKKLVLGALLCAGVFLAWRLVSVDPDAGRADAAGGLALERQADLQELEPGTGLASVDLAAAGLEDSGERSAAAAGGAVGPVAGNPWVISGFLQMADDRREEIPAITFRLTVLEGLPPGGEILREERVTNDSDGRFAWSLEDPDRTVSVAIAAEPLEGFRVVTYEPVPVIRGEGSPEALRVLVFPLDARAVGTVRGGGEPLAGARVEGMAGVVETGPDGRYSLPIFSAMGETLTAVGEGYGMGRQSPAAVAAGGEVQVDFDLPPEVRIRGRVIDSSGASVPGAEVSVHLGTTLSTTTDATGSFDLRGAPWKQGYGWIVRAEKEGYAIGGVATAGSEEPRSEETVEITLTRGVRVTGRVVDADGKPAAGASMWCGSSPNAWDLLRGFSDEEGRFTFDGVPAEALLVGAEKAGFASVQESLVLPADGADAPEMRLVLGESREIQGRVVDGAGEPVVGAYLAARQGGGYVGGNAISGEGGGFVLAQLPIGALQIEVFGKGLVRHYLDLPAELPDDYEVVVPARRSSGLRGRVVDAQSGKPLKSFTVRLDGSNPSKKFPSLRGYRSVWADPGRTFQSTDGTWTTGEHDNFEAGAWIGVIVEAEGYAPLLIQDVQVPAAGSEDELLHALLQPVNLVLQVFDKGTGQAHVDRRVDVHPVQDPWQSKGRWSVTTDGAGQAAVADFPPGPMYVTVRNPSGLDYRAEMVEIEAGDEGRRVEIQVPGGSQVIGAASIQGEPQVNRRVALYASAVPGYSHGQIEGVTGADGAFRFDDVPAGQWRLSLLEGEENSSGLQLAREFQVLEGLEEVQVELRADGKASVEIAATLAPDMLPGAQYLLRGEEAGLEFGGTLDSDGAASIKGVSPGTYSLRVMQSVWQKRMGFAGTVEVVVTEGDRSVSAPIEVKLQGD